MVFRTSYHGKKVFIVVDDDKRIWVDIDTYNEIEDNDVRALVSSYIFKTPGTMATEIPGVNEVVKHPIMGTTGSIFNIIIDLNDRYNWTREQIADWLETLDNIPGWKINEP